MLLETEVFVFAKQSRDEATEMKRAGLASQVWLKNNELFLGWFVKDAFVARSEKKLQALWYSELTRNTNKIEKK